MRMTQQRCIPITSMAKFTLQLLLEKLCLLIILSYLFRDFSFKWEVCYSEKMAVLGSEKGKKNVLLWVVTSKFQRIIRSLTKRLKDVDLLVTFLSNMMDYNLIYILVTDIAIFSCPVPFCSFDYLNLIHCLV